MNPIRFFARQSVFVNLMTVFILIMGLLSFKAMRREMFPALSVDWVVIMTAWPGAAPGEVEKLVTIPIEREIESIDGFKRIWSTSVENISVISIELDPNAPNRDKVVATIQREVDGVVGLPKDAEDPSVEEIEPHFPVITASLSSKNAKPLEMRLVAKKLQDRLEDIPGVGDASGLGLVDEEIWVEVDPATLERRRIPLQLVADALARRNVQLPGGRLELEGSEILVRTIGDFENEKDIRNIVVRGNDEGSTVRVKDIATVSHTLKEQRQTYRVNGRSSISFKITKKATGDSIEVADAVKEIAKDFEKNNPGYRLDLSEDSTFYIKRRLRVLTGNAVVGLVLVLVLLLLFLDFTTAVFTATGLAVALMAGIVIADFFGFSINMLTMFGFVMVLGMLVDDGVVVAENIFRRIRLGEDPQSAAENGAIEIALPLSASVLTTIAAFLPLIFMGGILGKFMSFIPLTVVICLVASVVESFLILPSHLADFSHWAQSRVSLAVGRFQARWVQAPFEKTKGLFLSSLKTATIHPYRVISAAGIAFIVVLAVTVMAFKTNWIYFKQFPVSLESFRIDFDLPRGASLKRTSAKAAEIEEIILALPKDEVDVVITTVGMNGDKDMLVRGSHRGSIQVALQRWPASLWERIKTLFGVSGFKHRGGDLIKDEVSAKVKKIKGLDKVTVRGRRAGPPTGKQVSILISDGSFAELKKVSEGIQAELHKIEGVTSIGDDLDPGKKEIALKVDGRRAAMAGLSVAQIAAAVRGALDGIEATTIKRGADEIVVRVRYTESIRRDPKALDRVKVATPRGRLLSLSSLVSFEEQIGQMQITHVDGKLSAMVTADVISGTKTSDGTVMNSNLANTLIEPKVQEQIAPYPRMTYKLLGENEDTQESNDSLKRLFLVALLLIYMILATQFKSLLQPFIIMVSIPLGLMGVSLVHLIHHLVGSMPFSMLSMLGTVALTGVVVNNAILLIEFANRELSEGKSAIDAVLAAGERRFRPIFLTSLTTIVGLLPMGYGIPELEPFLAPMALVLAWGITFSGIMTFYVVPSLWLILQPWMGNQNARKFE